jgi:group I intron endonuclease
MDTFTVYKITCITNEKLYVGYTKNKIEYRLKQHFNNSKKLKSKLSKAILKYGTLSFKIESLYTTNEKTDALLKEIYYIDYFDSINKGYNLTKGGEGGSTNKGIKFSDETKAKISKNHADVSGSNNPFYGKTHSNQTKLKIGERVYLKGENHHFYGKTTKSSFKEGKDHPKSQTIIINNIEYGSLTLAAKAFNISRQTLKKRYL